MSEPPELLPEHERLARVASRIAEARAAGDADGEARAHFDEAAIHSSFGRDGAALICCDRALAVDRASSAARALALHLREYLRDVPDLGVLASAAETLLAAGDWEHAASAWALVGRVSGRLGDLAEARRACATAIGCFEAAGAQRLGAGVMRELAGFERKANHPTRAIALLQRALRRLDGVPLLGARLEEAYCAEALGDAFADLADPQAAASWRDAADLQEGLDRRQAAAQIREKLAAWEKNR